MLKSNYDNNNNNCMRKAHTYAYAKQAAPYLPFASLTFCWHKQVKSNKNILFSEFIL